MRISHTKIITLSPELSGTGRKCSIHLDLSIVTILITPECCQPAKLGGEYWFAPANWLIAVFKGAVFPSTPPVSYFAIPFIFSLCLQSVNVSLAGGVVSCGISHGLVKKTCHNLRELERGMLRRRGAYFYCRAIGNGSVQGKGCSTSPQPLYDS